MTEYTTKDSGVREQFDSGMQRDTEAGKARFDLMIPEGVPYEEQLLTRFALLLSRGAEKYDARNWEKASGEAEIARAKSSAFRHFMQWFCDESDEDHAVAVIFNLMVVETTRAKLESEVDDEEGAAVETSRQPFDWRAIAPLRWVQDYDAQYGPDLRSKRAPIAHFTLEGDGSVVNNLTGQVYGPVLDVEITEEEIDQATDDIVAESRAQAVNPMPGMSQRDHSVKIYHVAPAGPDEQIESIVKIQDSINRSFNGYTPPRLDI